MLLQAAAIECGRENVDQILKAKSVVTVSTKAGTKVSLKLQRPPMEHGTVTFKQVPQEICASKDEEILRQPMQRMKIAQLMAKDLAAILDSPLFG